MCIPYPISAVEKPEFYQEIAQEEGNFALIEIPATKVYGAGIMAEYYQTIHGKPIVGGQVARTPQDARNFEVRTPFINEITYLKSVNDILSQNTTVIGTSILNHHKIKYIVIHSDYLKREELQFLLPLINQTLDDPPKTYENDNIIVYSVVETPQKMFMTISDGWNALEKWNDGPGRWMRKNASIFIYSPEDQDCTLSFEVGSFHIERDLSLYVNNELTGTYHISKKGYPDNTPDEIQLNIHLNKGDNVVQFAVSQPGTIPSEVEAWNDDRELSLAFQNIRII